MNATLRGADGLIAAAGYRDLALGLPPGTTDAAHGTKILDASACPSASPTN